MLLFDSTKVPQEPLLPGNEIVIEDENVKSCLNFLTPDVDPETSDSETDKHRRKVNDKALGNAKSKRQEKSRLKAAQKLDADLHKVDLKLPLITEDCASSGTLANYPQILDLINAKLAKTGHCGFTNFAEKIWFVIVKPKDPHTKEPLPVVMIYIKLNKKIDDDKFYANNPEYTEMLYKSTCFVFEKLTPTTMLEDCDMTICTSLRKALMQTKKAVQTIHANAVKAYVTKKVNGEPSNTFAIILKYAISGRPQGPYTVKKRMPRVLVRVLLTRAGARISFASLVAP